MFFEAGLARPAALHATEANLLRLKDALAANEAALGDLAQFQRTDAAFHLQLALIHNPIFKTIHDALEVWLVQQRTQSLMIPGAAQAPLRFHREIYESIADGNPGVAEEAMRDHLRSVAKFYWQSKGGSESAQSPHGHDLISHV